MLSAHPISLDSIAAVFDDATDCVKLISRDGRVLWMNRGGLCAMEISDFTAVRGAEWASFWPDGEAARLRDYLSEHRTDSLHFTAQCATARGTQKWWDVSIVPISTPQGQHGGYIASSRDATAREVAARTREVLLQEMRHRQGNTLTLASLLMQVHARGRPELSAFAAEMGDRLAALGRAQALVGQQTRTPGDDPAEDRDAARDDLIDVARILRVLVQPLAGPKCRLSIDVPPGIALHQDRIDVVGTVISELAVNSSKHGAFRHGGDVRLWTETEPGAQLSIAWHETSRAAVRRHARDGGQGLDLMRRVAEINGGAFDVEWGDKGHMARLRLPSEVRGGRQAA